jgi:hypothetical protein
MPHHQKETGILARPLSQAVGMAAGAAFIIVLLMYMSHFLLFG